ncbi:MAG: TMEM43 family protein [Xenococcaceae cyanobacterium]
MSDEYTEVEVVSWGSRIGSSCMGLVLGLILFFASFVVLYWNEGRVDFSQVANTAVEISATSPNTAAQGKLISTTGSLTSPQVLGDNLFLNPGKYIAVRRDVEMFAWEEEQKTETKKNVGGSETRTTTYSYSKKWVDTPEESSDFKISEGHYNPPKSIKDLTNRVSQAKVGIYSLDIKNIDLPQLNQVQLNRQNITLKDGVSQAGNYLFKGNGTMGNPEVGDLRLQYFVLPNGTNVTVFGKLESNNRITPYFYQDNQRLYRIFAGSREQAISTLKTEHKIWTWVLRLVGFLMMWIGLALALEPISVILDFLPFLGSITRGITGASTFIIAFVLSSITILVSMLLHNIVALAIAVVVAIGVGIALRKMKQ